MKHGKPETRHLAITDDEFIGSMDACTAAVRVAARGLLAAERESFIGHRTVALTMPTALKLSWLRVYGDIAQKCGGLRPFGGLFGISLENARAKSSDMHSTLASEARWQFAQPERQVLNQDW